MVNYSRIIGRAARLMKNPSVIDPPRQITGKGLQMGSRKNRDLRWRKKFFGVLLGILGIFENL
jgi:hypothetical protein